jgi:hypothetical protein
LVSFVFFSKSSCANKNVAPAQAGTHGPRDHAPGMDSHLRGNDVSTVDACTIHLAGWFSPVP